MKGFRLIDETKGNNFCGRAARLSVDFEDLLKLTAFGRQAQTTGSVGL